MYFNFFPHFGFRKTILFIPPKPQLGFIRIHVPVWSDFWAMAFVVKVTLQKFFPCFLTSEVGTLSFEGSAALRVTIHLSLLRGKCSWPRVVHYCQIDCLLLVPHSLNSGKIIFRFSRWTYQYTPAIFIHSLIILLKLLILTLKYSLYLWYF